MCGLSIATMGVAWKHFNHPHVIIVMDIVHTKQIYNWRHISDEEEIWTCISHELTLYHFATLET